MCPDDYSTSHDIYLLLTGEQSIKNNDNFRLSLMLYIEGGEKGGVDGGVAWGLREEWKEWWKEGWKEGWKEERESRE